jgi:outer membrane protein assembly factor BamB
MTIASRSCLLVLLTIACGQLAASEQWTQWRGPDQLGITEVTGLPVEWDDETNMRWKTQLPGPGSSQPVVWNDRIFVTAFSGYDPSEKQRGKDVGPASDLRLHVSCLNADDGSLIWSKELESLNEIVQSARNVAHHGFATPTPIVDEKRVYASFGTCGLFCFDHSGKELWRTNMGGNFAGWGYAASLAQHNNLLVVNAAVAAGALLGIDKATGDIVWRNETDMDFEKSQRGLNRSWSTPLIWQNAEGAWRAAVLVVGQSLNVYDPGNGELLWQVKNVSGGYACNTPVPNEDGSILYCFAGGSHGTVTASAIRTGSGIQDRVIWQHERRGSALVPPVFYKNRLYYGAYGGVRPKTAQCIGCLDPATGDVIFEQELEELERNVIYGPTFAGDDKVYIQSMTNGTYVLDATVPEYRLLARNVLDADQSTMGIKGAQTESTNGMNAMPVPLADGSLLLRSYWGVYRVGGSK